MAPPTPRAGAFALRRLLVLAALVACGCRSAEPGVPVGRAIGVGPGPSSLVPRACRARSDGRKLERRGSDASVDRYYEATVYAAGAVAAVAAGPLDSSAFEEARDLYNACLLDCLRAGQRFGRLDARSALRVDGPSGSMVVPVRRGGFVWDDEDFDRVVDPASAPPNPSAHADNATPGLGAAVVIERDNPRRGGGDDFLPEVAAFNATAVLRPDLDAWLGPGGRPPVDALELYDPHRAASVPFGPAAAVPLRADPDAAVAVARDLQERRGRFALAGFARPEEMLDKAGIRLIEPYRPGKSPVLLIHGLINDPFMFNDLLASLRAAPGFLDRYQIWVYRYPTGVTFIRTAAILREEIETVARALDPDGLDPALADWTLIGYSMGGLIARLQVSSSGDSLWDEVAARPLDELRMDEESRRLLRGLFFFEPSPRVRRVIFLATPHGGASPLSAAASRLTSVIVRRPTDTLRMIDQVERDNPGAVRPALRRLPSSVDALAAYSPIPPAIRRLPYGPGVELHTIAGTGHVDPSRGGLGDGVVPLASAHVDEAISEHRVRARHTAVYYHPDAIAEIRRLLGVPPR